MAADKKDPNDVSTTSSAHDAMGPRIALIEALLQGTEGMRAAGRELLPQHEEESNAAYSRRLQRTTLLNYTEAVLDTLVSRPFRKPLTLKDDTPKTIVDLAENIDLIGNHLNVFARNWFRDGLAKGLSHVLIDFPTTARDGEDGQVRTLDDDRKAGYRPYWVHVSPENVIAAFFEDGQLSHLRIRETTIERNGFAEQAVTRIKVLEPGSWAVYVQPPKSSKWVIEDSGPTGLSYIPLVTFYAGKMMGNFEAKPPLTDLAHLNVSHWQSSSDQRHVLTVARFPLLAVSGVTDTEGVKIGPNNYLTTPTDAGKWYYVEHTGAAIEAGAKDLATLEEQMAGYGAEFLKRKSGTETATERALDGAEAVSSLEAMALDFRDALEMALAITADWLREPQGGSIDLATSFDAGEAGSVKAEILLKVRAQRDLTRESFLNSLKLQGVLPEDFDVDAEVQSLEDEAEKSLSNMMFDKGGTGGGGPRETGATPSQNKRVEPTGDPSEDD